MNKKQIRAPRNSTYRAVYAPGFGRILLKRVNARLWGGPWIVWSYTGRIGYWENRAVWDAVVAPFHEEAGA